MTTTLPPRTRLIRRVGIAAAATSALAGGWVLPTPSAVAAPSASGEVLVFNDPAFVDTEDESLNMQRVLSAADYTVSTVDTASASAIETSLAGKQTFVIPETEEGSLSGLDEESVQVIQDWVSAGGTLVFGYDNGSNVNTVFDTSVESGPSSEDNSWSLAASPGPAFAGGPAELPANNATTDVAAASLPAGGTAEYVDGGSAAVYDFTYGTGTVVGLGWDWFDAATPQNPEAQDGGWNDVLARAAGIVPPDTTAPQTTITKVTTQKVKAGARGDNARAKVTVTFKADGPATFRCKIDSKAYTPCTSPYVVRLKAAKHTVRVVATDEAGNADATPATRTFQVVRAKRN